MYANSINQFIGVTYEKLFGKTCDNHYSIFTNFPAAKESCSRDSHCTGVMDIGCDGDILALCLSNQFINQLNSCVYEKIGKL